MVTTGSDLHYGDSTSHHNFITTAKYKLDRLGKITHPIPDHTHMMSKSAHLELKAGYS